MVSATKVFIKNHLPFLAAAIRTLANLVSMMMHVTNNNAFANFIRRQSSKKRIKQLLKTGNKTCIEVGAGNKKGKNGWFTIDVTTNCDIYWDLRRGLPFPDGSISKIYSSHFLEHLTFHEAQTFLDECLRILVSGGSFSICVPNARLYIQAYLDSRTDGIDLDNEYVYKPAFNNTTKIDYVNYMAYMNGEHKYMFDEDNLVYILKAKGFKNVRLREFDLALDIIGRDFESIYAEAEK